MKRIILTIVFAVALFLCAPRANAAAPCGSGVICFDVVGTLSNANQATSSPVIMYTAPSGGSGARINAVMAYGVSPGSYSATSLWIVHSSVDYLLMENSIPVVAAEVNAANFLTANGTFSALTGLPVDENGNPFIFLSAGDSIALSNNAGITSSGAQSGVYYFHIIGESF
jgi:hypothetical protein